MKIFSELIIDSCFKNSEYCTCSIFRMISVSSIFAIVILQHFACKNLVGPGAPNLLCSLHVEELKPCQAFLIKMFEAPMISKSIVYARKLRKAKKRTTLISSVFLHLDRPFNNRPSSPFRHLRHLLTHQHLFLCGNFSTQRKKIELVSSSGVRILGWFRNYGF